MRKITRDVAALIANNLNKPDIEYQYNALRQRVVKIVKPRDPNTKLLRPITEWIYTYYVYDATGNVLAVYDRSTTLVGGNYKDAVTLAENHIYGSSRLALARPTDPATTGQWYYYYPNCDPIDPPQCIGNRSVTIPPAPQAGPTFTYHRALGYKEFELNNHLENVIATVSDRKINLSNCVNLLVTFTSAPTMTAVNTNTDIGTGQLKVTPTASNGGITLSYTVEPDEQYLVGFDIAMSPLDGVTPEKGTFDVKDGLIAKIYGCTSATCNVPTETLLITGPGHYQLTHNTGPGETIGYMELAFTTANGTTGIDPDEFYLDDFAVAKANNSVTPSTPACSLYVGLFNGYFPDLLMHTDYYAFGMQMPGRTWYGAGDEYRYGNNNQENIKEIFNGCQDFGRRSYDGRTGRFFSKDPFSRFFPNGSPYINSGNSPIMFMDEEGGFQIVPGTSAKGKNYRSLINVVKAVSRMANENNGENDFVKTFMLMAGVTKEKALEILSYGTGPIVVATNNQELIGSKTPGKKVAGRYIPSLCINGQNVDGICEFIFIDNDLISNINNSEDGKQSVLSNIIALTTLWHEGMHYADYLDLSIQPANSFGEDIGTQAENMLFGFLPKYENLGQFYKTKQTNNSSPTPSSQDYFLGTNTAINMFWNKYNHGGTFERSYSVDLIDVAKTVGSVVRSVGNFLKGVFNGGSKPTLKKSGASF